MSKIVAFVGLAGAGKTEAAKIFAENGYQYLRFGQIVLDKAIRRSQVDEKTEREIREDLRRKYGLGAMAVLNMDKIKKLLKKGSVVIDGLYSWEEYKILKKQFKKLLIVIAIYASPKTRYERFKRRILDPKQDPQVLYRPYTRKEAQSRDFSQIENLDQGGPIAMADFTIINNSAKKDFRKEVEKLFCQVEKF